MKIRDAIVLKMLLVTICCASVTTCHAARATTNPDRNDTYVVKKTQPTEHTGARVLFVKGNVFILRMGQQTALLQRHEQLVANDRLVIGKYGFVSMQLTNGRVQNIQPGSRVLTSPPYSADIVLPEDRKKSMPTVSQPHLSAAVRG